MKKLTYNRRTIELNGQTFNIGRCKITKASLKKNYIVAELNGISYGCNLSNGFAYELIKN
jgi:hypothetical protein